jgi:hypothetical protein
MANPLSLFMPVLPGLTLQDIAGALAGIQSSLDQALEEVGTVHYARTLFLDASVANLQPSLGPAPSAAAGAGDVLGATSVATDTLTPEPRYVIGIITEYDGDFGAYIQDFVNHAKDPFNAVLKLVVGGEAVTPVENNVSAFKDFITRNDASQHQPNNGFQPDPSGASQPAASGASQDAPRMVPTPDGVPGGLYQAYPQTVQLIKAAFS